MGWMPSATSSGKSLTPAEPVPPPAPEPYFRSLWLAALGGDCALWPVFGSAWWPPVYVWMRANGAEPESAAQQTVSFFAWVEEVAPPSEGDREFVRLSDFIITRLVSFQEAGFPAVSAVRPVIIDKDLGERRFGVLAGRSPTEAYNRRWALSVLENTVAALRLEYGQEGAGALLDHLVPFLSFNTTNQNRYPTAASACGLSVSALNVAVFRFRQRYREKLRSQISDTVSAQEEVDSELTRLLVAGS